METDGLRTTTETRIRSDEDITNDVIRQELIGMRTDLHMIIQYLERMQPLIEYAEKYLNSSASQRLWSALKK